MAPLDITVRTPEQVLMKAQIETGTISPAFKAQYVWNGALVHFYYQDTTGVDCFMKYVEALGLDLPDVDYEPVARHDETIEIMDRDDIDARYKEPGSPDYYVEIKRRGVLHYLWYTVAEHQGRSLEDFLDEIGLYPGHLDRRGFSDVRIVALNLADWEDRDDVDMTDSDLLDGIDN